MLTLFKTPVQRTQLNTEIAGEFFQHITGNKYMQDDSLVCVARAILPPRMQEGDHVNFYYQPKHIQRDAVFDGGSEEIEACISSEIDLSAENLVTIYYFAGARRSDSAPYMDAIQEHFAAKHRGWVENERVRVAYGGMFPILSFANTSKRSVVLFMGEADLKRQRFAIQGVFSSMSWYFNADEHPLTDDERELLTCIISNEPEDVSEQKFYAAIDRIAAQYDFEKIRVSRMLDGFESRYERRAIESAKRAVDQHNAKIADYNRCINEELVARRESMIRLAGLEMRVKEDGEASAIRDLFLNNPRLYLERISDDYIFFSVRTELEYYDTDCLESCISNRRSWVYREGNTRSEDMAKLLRAVFIDNTIKLQVCAGYRLNMAGNVEGLSDHDFPAGFIKEYMPNTHINNYSCLGDHVRTINECLCNGDYVGALMQCIASCQSLNFNDSTVMRRFMDHLYADRYSGFRLPDGRVVKPSAAIQWLKAQEVQDEQKEPEAATTAEA